MGATPSWGRPRGWHPGAIGGLVLLPWLAVLGCGNSKSAAADAASVPPDASADTMRADIPQEDGPVDAGVDAPNDRGAKDARPEAAVADLATSDASSSDGGATYRTSLGVCWTDPSCRRALIVSHGGDWDLSVPYGSRAAFQRAYDNGADAIKCDLRITKDGVAVASHSSPLELWESLDCAGKKIEDMTAAQVTSCHMLLTQETFPRVDDVLAWAKGKLIVMLTVKEPKDFAGGIATVIAAGAQDYAFFEIDPNNFINTIPSAPGWGQVRYLVQIKATSDLDLMINTVKDPTHAFMYEMEPTYPNATVQDVANLVTTRLRPAGIRPFVTTASNPLIATVQNHTDLFNQGFDVLMSYNLANGVVARKQANQARGINPP